MNILYCTQSSSLRLFHSVNSALDSNDISVESVGFTIADSYNYEQWLNDNSSFEKGGYHILKEWEVTDKRNAKPDLDKLAAYEKELGGEAGLFGAIVADRRMFMGPDCTYSQDYRRRFSDDELLCILQHGLEEMERLFNELKPDVLVSFISVTMLDYLAYLFAKARGVRIFNLRPTRIGDRVSFSNMLNDPSPELSAAYFKLEQGSDSKYKQDAKDYIKRVKEKHGRYEGVIKPSDKPALKVNTSQFMKLGGVLRLVGNYIRYRRSISAKDNHVADPLRNIIFNLWKNPRRAKKANSLLKDEYISGKALKKLRYVFYPLHTEPEVSLLVYGRPYVNQIEVIRMLAMSLPIDTVLLIKEHPWMVGKRSLASYKKLLNIPRVMIADPKQDARILIQESDMIAVITGSVALEAALIGKPVLTLGDCPYNLLPDSMIRRCDDPRRLQSIIRELLEEYNYDDVALENYVAGVMETSVGVNLYSVLLEKKNVYIERGSTYNDEIEKLANYLHLLINDGLESLNTEYSAKW